MKRAHALWKWKRLRMYAVEQGPQKEPKEANYLNQIKFNNLKIKDYDTEE